MNSELQMPSEIAKELLVRGLKAGGLYEGTKYDYDLKEYLCFIGSSGEQLLDRIVDIPFEGHNGWCDLKVTPDQLRELDKKYNLIAEAHTHPGSFELSIPWDLDALHSIENSLQKKMYAIILPAYFFAFQIYEKRKEPKRSTNQIINELVNGAIETSDEFYRTDFESFDGSKQKCIYIYDSEGKELNFRKI